MALKEGRISQTWLVPRRCREGAILIMIFVFYTLLFQIELEQKIKDKIQRWDFTIIISLKYSFRLPLTYAIY